MHKSREKTGALRAFVVFGALYVGLVLGLEQIEEAPEEREPVSASEPWDAVREATWELEYAEEMHERGGAMKCATDDLEGHEASIECSQIPGQDWQAHPVAPRQGEWRV